MHFILSPMGSAGDVHPFLGLALALRERGHGITFVVVEYFRELIERHGLKYVQVGTTEEFLASTRNPNIWKPRKALQHVYESGIRPAMPLQFEAFKEHFVPGETVGIGSALGFGALIAREKLGIPLITLHLQPAVLWSDIEPPTIPGAFGPKWLQPWLYRIGVKYVIDPVILPSLNAYRRELGLPPIASVPPWWHSPDCVISMFPEWYCPPQADWPPNHLQTDFPLWDAQADEPLADEVESFLAAGDAPLVFTPGSANVFGAAFFRTAVDACQRLGRRGILLTRFPEQIPAKLPRGVRHFPYVPLTPLLARCAALVHHGGIGTASQAMTAGIPQLIMALAHDQYDNATRVTRLGIGDWLTPTWFSGGRVAKRLSRLLESADVRKSCREVADRLKRRDGLDETAAAVENWSSRRLQHRSEASA
ncbi:MAG: glycosyltransferase [Pirellulaceae bacterium]|jgi:rhamnosyltransferase subunit B|nr:glycosyltransferase [Pirellulaceae bacterium]